MTSKFKIGDKVIIVRYMDSTKTFSNDMPERVRTRIENKTILTVNRISKYLPFNITLEEDNNYPFSEGELELYKIENWRRELK